MKSVSLSQVTPIQPAHRLARPWHSRRPLAALATLALTLSSGLALIAALLMLLLPGTPAVWIVLPVLLGGSLPLFAALPARFDVTTRFDAAHFVKTLERSLAEMGYAPAASAVPGTRCYQRPAGLLRWQEGTISLAVYAHAITVGGPLPALRQLQQRLMP